MIEQELLFLGLLKQSPKHGYEIKKKIKEILALFSGIELKSVYYPLQVLERKGLLTKHITKSGRRPERLVYALTPKGEQRFAQLLTKSFLDFKRPQFSLDLSLYFLRYIRPRVAQRRLRARTLILKNLTRELKQAIVQVRTKKDSTALVYILEHDLQMVESESKFLINLTKTL